jgi:methionine sulfoxide reductase heme-binding subunit
LSRGNQQNINMRRFLISKWTKRVVFLLCLVPAVLLIVRAFTGGLGANPISTITLTTGDWTLYFLLMTLAITPLRKLLHQPDLIRFRKMLGLYAFTYACLHFLTLIVFDHFFDFAAILEDVYKRPFITAGFTAFVLMIPLAITSTTKMIRRLGKRWVVLHRLVYISAVLAIVHYYWLVKSDVTLPVRYGCILAVLLGARVFLWWRDKHVKSTASLAKPSPATAQQ